MKNTLSVLALSTLPIFVQANQTILDMVDMDKARKEAHEASKKIEAYLNRDDKESEVVSTIDLSKLPVPAIEFTGNLSDAAEELANQFAMLSQREQQLEKMKLFISWSIPEKSLIRYFEEASRIGSRYIQFSFIGIPDGSTIQKTATRISNLAKKYDVEIQIDPDAFTRYKINKVPTLLIYEDNELFETKCSASGDLEKLKEFRDSFIGVSGDTSIEFALEYVAKHNKDSRFYPFVLERLDSLKPN